MAHPTAYNWTLYCTNQRAKKKTEITIEAWQAHMQPMMTIRTAEEFWHIYNNIRQPADIEKKGDYYMFKRNIHPEWEDPANEKGGAWMIRCNEHNINTLWLEVLLSLIGGSLEDYMENVCGAVLSARNTNYRLAVWINTTEESIALPLGKLLKEKGNISEPMKFESHHNKTDKPLYTL